MHLRRPQKYKNLVYLIREVHTIKTCLIYVIQVFLFAFCLKVCYSVFRIMLFKKIKFLPMKNLFKRFINFFVFLLEQQKENKELRKVNKNLNSLSKENEEFFGGENALPIDVSVQIQSPEITS